MQRKPSSCKTVDELNPGDRVEVVYTVTDDDVQKFAELSGDWNPLHFDEAYASKTMFKGRIAHGLISLAKFSGIFGMDMPGLGTLWETQEVRFCAPVFLNVQYKAVARVSSVEKRRVVVETWVEDKQGMRVLEGRAVVIPVSTLLKLTWEKSEKLTLSANTN